MPNWSKIRLVKLMVLDQAKAILALLDSTCPRPSQHVHGKGRVTAKAAQRLKSKLTGTVVLVHDWACNARERA
jgi:hypothetical protein